MSIGEKRKLRYKQPFESISKRANVTVSFDLPLVNMEETSRAGEEKMMETDEGEDLLIKSCYVQKSRLSESREGSKVVFSQETKPWCGLRPDRLYYDELVYQFFILGRQFSSVDVLRLIGLDTALINCVSALLLDLCERVEKSCRESAADEDSGVPVLLRGGGRGMKVTAFHHPYLVTLQQVVAEAGKFSALGFSLERNESDKNRLSSTNKPRQRQNAVVA